MKKICILFCIFLGIATFAIAEAPFSEPTQSTNVRYRLFPTQNIYTFLKRVANCYSNSRVLLSDGRSGQVVFLNNSALSRPIVKLGSGEMVDLSAPDNHEIFIKSIL